jgi:hypothetical protein
MFSIDVNVVGVDFVINIVDMLLQAIVDNMDAFRKEVTSDAEVNFVPHGEKIASFEAEAVSVFSLIIRVARWFVFKPKIPIWVIFAGSCNGKSWYIL